ncbi:MAG: hypothetical protein R3E85_07560 [Planctomycetota bacterium]
MPILNGTSSLLETLEQLGIDEERTWIILNAQKGFPGQLTPADVEAHLNRAVRHEVTFDKKLPMASTWAARTRAAGRSVEPLPPQHRPHRRRHRDRHSGQCHRSRRPGRR